MSIKTDRAHYARVEQYVRRVQSLYYNVAKYCAQTSTMHKPKGDIFYFKDIPTLNRQVDQMFGEMSKSFETTILSGITGEWDMANVNNDDLVIRMRKKVPNLPMDIYQDRNLKALESFQQRKVGGLNLSERVWKYTSQFKNEIEQSLDIGMAQGRSASEISLDIMKYLQNPDSLMEKLITKNGIVHVMNENTNLHPGQGVYRSSYKNAMRLTRTEVNSAYRRSDYERWQQLDFVVGIEIRRSNREYACDVCESLKGKYPKDFKFYGWHPHCRCHALSILATEKEFMEGLENGTKSKKEVEKIPENFNSWMDKNNSRIQRSKNQPYFIKDNKGKITIPPKNLEELMSRASKSSGEVMKIANELAAKYNGYAVPINLKGEKRILEKVRGELKGEIAGIKDAVRTTIILPQNDLRNIIRDSEKMSTFVRVRNQTPDNFYGYSGLLTNIRTKNGIRGEIQFNTPKMIYAKEKPKDAKFLLGVETWNAIKKETGMPGGLGHKYYEQIRVLDIVKDASLYKALKKKSIEYYKHFI